jgi:tRNA(fMet)-specific endonuclease VapC
VGWQFPRSCWLSYTWAYGRPHPDRLLRPIEDDLLQDVAVLDFDTPCAKRFGALRANLLTTGVVINAVDLMIAAVAITYDLTLVTHNTKHFQGVPGLRVEDWLSP